VALACRARATQMSGSDSAFPQETIKLMEDGLCAVDKITGYFQTVKTGGLTKRELFAAMAMQGLLSAVYSTKEMLNEFTTDGSGAYKKHVTGGKAICDNALFYADALIKALEDSRGK
jgi:hypothetical protein